MAARTKVWSGGGGFTPHRTQLLFQVEFDLSLPAGAEWYLFTLYLQDPRNVAVSPWSSTVHGGAVVVLDVSELLVGSAAKAAAKATLAVGYSYHRKRLASLSSGRHPCSDRYDVDYGACVEAHADALMDADAGANCTLDPANSER